MLFFSLSWGALGFAKIWTLIPMLRSTLIHQADLTDHLCEVVETYQLSSPNSILCNQHKNVGSRLSS